MPLKKGLEIVRPRSRVSYEFVSHLILTNCQVCRFERFYSSQHIFFRKFPSTDKTLTAQELLTLVRRNLKIKLLLAANSPL
jgi:hypothetical protein